jgi:hypothetical protein
MDNRLINAAEGIIFGLIFAGLYWIVGFVVKRLTGKEIRTNVGYLIAVVLGFLSRRTLIVLLTG